MLNGSYLKYQLSVGLNAKAGFWLIEIMTKTQHRQNNIEPLNMIQYWYRYCHLGEMVDESIECTFLSRYKAQEYKVTAQTTQVY